MFWPIWALLLLRATGKGGTASGSYGGTGGVYSGGGIVASRAAYASTGAFAAVVLLSAGSRRRYGTYYDPQDRRCLCTLLSEDEMNSSCSNLIGNETVCHDCIACETEDCMTEISNCDEFLATVFTECCVEDCDVGSSTPITALFAVPMAEGRQLEEVLIGLQSPSDPPVPSMAHREIHGPNASRVPQQLRFGEAAPRTRPGLGSMGSCNVLCPEAAPFAEAFGQPDDVPEVPLPFMKSPDEQQTGFLIQTVGGAAGEGRVKRILANKNVIL
eukprot:g22065.t1